MKKITLLSAASLMALGTFAQKVIRHPDGSYFKQCTHFYISKPLREIAKEYPVTGRTDGVVKIPADAARKFPYRIVKHSDTPQKTVSDPVVQTTQGTVASSGTIVSVDGQTSGYEPLDPNGMIGSNYYVQAINSNYEVFNKDGSQKTASIDLASLFPGSDDEGDPVVMYDKFADRWIIEEFQTPGGEYSGNNITEMQFAVSETSDPTGAYYIYVFTPDANDFADYPKFSIWSDGYYETCNCDNQKVTVYQRAKMITGDPTAGFIVIPSIYEPAGSGGGFWCPQTLYADGTLPPYGSPEYLFDFTSASWGGSFTDQIRIYKITVDWTNTTGTIATTPITLPTQPANCVFTGGTEKDISQPGKPNSLDALDGFFSYRIPYLRWGTYNTALMCNPVNVGSGSTIVSGIRWYELHQDTTTKAWSVYQQGTYAPNDGVSRWNPSIAMDQNGSIGLAYSVSDPTSVYPGSRYTGRRKCDSLGVMTLTEQVGVAGSSSRTNGHRWGDYSHTSVDPSDGITFWHTNMYFGSGEDTRIYSFQIPTCTNLGVNNITAKKIVFTAYQSDNEINIKASNLPSSNNLNLNLYNIAGKYISGKSVMPTANALQTTISTIGLAKGFYFIRIGNNDFQRVLKIVIQ